MLKFMVGIAIVAFSSFCGYRLTGKYRRKKQFFKHFSTFNSRFLEELSYSRRPLGEILSKNMYSGEFQLLLYAFATYLKERDKEFFLTLNEEVFSFLSEDEKMEICDYFLTLGKGDSRTQKEYFSSMKGRVETRFLEAEERCKRYTDLYIKLGFLCGLFILILII